ncbi:hypothetical protein I607_02875 [Alteromonas mediterranea U4]|nr:hypothetical protein I607_02875 [Alteromonas mediterranea U4]
MPKARKSQISLSDKTEATTILTQGEINEFKPNDVITKFDNIDIGPSNFSDLVSRLNANMIKTFCVKNDNVENCDDIEF